ncbi:MAG: 23S rRNA (guanosine(2251)-2'-O)-methyltransferase RlmB [Deltaproteobacteria bacterium]|jgi:23S rRNA (guanosine2251-2'-O)-methyltransferase|nr:23S rRNA (guanosine(2251)-2'-O)-methyltransferase RlmB [Deltaproteobacteria bacterium]
MQKNNNYAAALSESKRCGPEEVAAPAPEADQITNFLPGLKPVLELLQSAPEKIDCVFVRKGRRDKRSDALLDRCREQGVRFSLLEEKPFVRLYAGPSQGVLARLFATGFVDLEDLLAGAAGAPLPLLLALDQVLDPGNAGTLARTLYALGGAGLILPRHQAAFLGAAAAKAAAGALQKLPVAKVTNLAVALDKAAEAGFRIYGAAAGAGAASVYGVRPEFPAVLVLGSEEAGLRPGIAKRCDRLLAVPMLREFDSLNVAQAGAIIMGFLSAGR